MILNYGAAPAAGRSPRARGSPFFPFVGVFMQGSIPACAGKPNLLAGGLRPPRVDPRVRGEAITLPFVGYSQQGRSPRARGSRFEVLRSGSVWRSIPACAGKPFTLTRATRPIRVDPRVRGEAESYGTGTVLFPGRSPRARGSRFGTLFGCSGIGSIPACAGKPHTHRHHSPHVRVDPRVRGEANPNTRTRCRCTGRSPRARGSHLYRRHAKRRRGSIPACAGKPEQRGRAGVRLGVDPRVRGEAQYKYQYPYGDAGRSPRARGSRLLRQLGRHRRRSIPACAGKP